MIWNVFSWIGQSQPVETGEDSAGGGRTSTQSGGQGPGHDPESALISTRSSASLAGVAPQPGAGGPVCAGVPVLPPDLRQVERTAHASYHEDGLEEIFGGIIAVGLSLMLLTAGKPWLIQLALIPVVFLLGIARQRITYPRI